ncbi:TonB-dependent receptor plug domain-containing protein [Flavobacterium kayseriense]|uniref:TonB-dependent receptor plug domain-containing protein n=1 Tax=Flavobacterium kayseriense TaxID=2764714 RepID=UPI001C9A8DEA|nr:TonB-dependent receptor plug domain-containing protein [Flavobacterium kayseriense]
MNKKIVRISALCLLVSACTFAQKKGIVLPVSNELNEVVISDSKFALSKEKSGKVIVKITAEDLKKRPGQSVASILSTVAGVEINGNQSRNGKDLGMYIRGGRGNQVLIMIDGVPVTDASGIDLSYDLRLLPVDQIESIEIMKGASSTLYGSGAATGVINITLKKADTKAIAGAVYLNMGTQNVAKESNNTINDFNQGFSFNGKSHKFNYFAALNSTESTGISEAKSASENIAFEKDAFSRVNSIVKFGFTPNKKLSLDFFASYDKLRNEFDSGSFADNKDNFSTSEQYRIGFSPKYKYNGGEIVMNSSASSIERDLFNFGSFSYYKSRNINADVFNKYNVLPELFIVTGAQFQFHEMSNKSDYAFIPEELAKFNMFDPYATAVYNSDFGLNLNVGARYTMHSQFGNNLVYNLNPSYVIPNMPLKVLASYSTAFIAPSLYQLYSEYGDIALAPQKDATFELGLEAKLFSNKITVTTIAFFREEVDAIGFDLTAYEYFNVLGKNKVRGIETMIVYDLSDKVRLNANYTFTDLERQSRILNPKNKVNAGIDVQATTRLAFSATYQFVSDRYTEYTTYPAPAFVPVLNSEILKNYQLVNATIRYVVIKNRLNVFAAADNLLDKDFVEARGFSTRGRNFRAGLNINF